MICPEIQVYFIEDYFSNVVVKSTVERKLELIGEATSNLLSIEPEISITDFRKIITLYT